MKKVVLVWGGWPCMAGYIHWAYVAEYVDNPNVNTEIPGVEKIGEYLFKPPYRKEINDPKNCDYGKEPSPFRIQLCRQWIEENDHELVVEVKMRTD